MRRQRRRDADGNSASKERRFETRVRRSIGQFAAGNRADDDKDVASTHGGMGVDPSVNSPPEIGRSTTKMWRLNAAEWAPIRRSIHRRKSTSFRQLRFGRVPPPPPPPSFVAGDDDDFFGIPVNDKRTHGGIRVSMATWTEFTRHM